MSAPPAPSSAQQDAAPTEEIWLSDGNTDWQLTWPIWHMLPRQERKELAVKHGYKTIGEFEEYMSLQRAVGDSSSTVPYDNRLVYGSADRDILGEDSKPAAKPTGKDRAAVVTEDEEDDENSVDEQLERAMEKEYAAAADELPTDERMERGGAILMLPEETLHKIFDWLPVDAYAALALVSPHWRSFTRTEAVYRRLCERLYLNQSQRRALHVSRFNNSYRTMLERRPRVRAGGGMYILKYARVKKIDRNMWTDVSS